MVFIDFLLSLPIFECSKILKSCFLTKIIRLSKDSFGKWAWPVLDFTEIYRGMFCKIENGFYWLACFHCEYLRAQKFKKCCFLTKMTRLSRHKFEK